MQRGILPFFLKLVFLDPLNKLNLDLALSLMF